MDECADGCVYVCVRGIRCVGKCLLTDCVCVCQLVFDDGEAIDDNDEDNYSDQYSDD